MFHPVTLYPAQHYPPWSTQLQDDDGSRRRISKGDDDDDGSRRRRKAWGFDLTVQGSGCGQGDSSSLAPQ